MKYPCYIWFPVLVFPLVIVFVLSCGSSPEDTNGNLPQSGGPSPSPTPQVDFIGPIPTFSSLQNFTVGALPNAIAFGDLNGDGITDLAVTNRLGASVSILINTTPASTSVFSFVKTDVVVGSNPVALAVGDLNADGKIDLAIANLNANTVSVLMNKTATGTTTPLFTTTTVATGLSPKGIALADITTDGKLDLLVTNGNEDSVSVLRNGTVSGSFIPNLTRFDFAVGNLPCGIVGLDLDQDGKIDLAVVNEMENSLTILQNNTTTAVPTFSRSDFQTSAGPISIAAANLNGIGKEDLVLTNKLANQLSLFTNQTQSPTASPLFEAQTQTVGQGPASVAAADLNSDNKTDLIVANSIDNTITVLTNNTPKHKALVFSSDTRPVGNFPSAVALVDLNGDGKPDLVIANQQFPGELNIFANTTSR